MKIGKKVARDSIFSAFRTLLVMVRGIVVIPLITKLLGAGYYGVWTTALAIITLMSSVGGVHLHGSLIRYSKDWTAARQVYADTIFLSIILGAFAGGSVFVMGNAIDIGSLLGDQDLNATSLIMVCAGIIFSDIVLKVNLNFPRALGRVQRYELIRTGRMFVETIVLIVVFLTGGNIVHGLVGLFIVSIVGNLVIGSSIAWKYGLTCPSMSNFERYFRYGTPMIPKELSSTILSKMDRLLILYFLSPAAAGIYAVAYGLSTLLKNVTTILNSSLYPTVASAWDNDEMEELEALYQNIFRYTTVLIIPSLFGITLLAQELMVLISTEEIASQGVILVPLLCIGFLVRAYEDPIDYILTASKNTEKIGIAVGIAAILNLILNVFLIPRYGLIGAAVATFISEVLITAIVYTYANTELRLLFPIRTLLLAIISSVLMSVILLYSPKTADPLINITIYSTAGALVYFGLMLLIGGISLRELKQVRSL